LHLYFILKISQYVEFASLLDWHSRTKWGVDQWKLSNRAPIADKSETQLARTV